jgi:hypothetical protein
MGQFSVEKPVAPGSVLSGNQHGLALNSNYTISRDRAFWRAVSDDPTYLASLEPFFEGMRKAGVPEQ